MWSQRNQRYELYLHGQAEQHFSVQGGEAFSAWVRSQISFAFVGQSGRLSVLKEARERGRGYWYAYHKHGQHTHKGYLGPSERLTFARLEEVAGKLNNPTPSPTRAIPISRREKAEQGSKRTAAAHPHQEQSPLLSTKFSPPRLPSFLVERADSRTSLQAVRTHALTLVSASAGSGKTTLLSTWSATARLSQIRGEGRLMGTGSDAELVMAWLSLDSLDNNPLRFWHVVIAALRNSLPSVGEQALALLQARQAPPLSTILTALLNDLVPLSRDCLLMLDDYHLIEEAEIHDSMRFLLDHAPTHLHLVLATRRDPDLALARLRVHGQLLEIRDQDLSLTLSEASSFLVQGMDLPLSEEQVGILYRRTGGWIAGLHLAALSARSCEDLSAWITDFGGSHRYLLDYVQQDILAQLPHSLQNFLLQTSVVNRMNAAICQAVAVGMTQDACQHMLEEVERANLFVVPLDERRQWYRYHDLFREVLLARLLARQPDVLPLLHIRAAHWYEGQSEIREAIMHALAAPDFSYAADLLEQAAPVFWLNGEARTIHNWVLALPNAVLRAHLRLTLNAAFRLLNSASITTSVGHAALRAQVESLQTRLEEILHQASRFSLTDAEAGFIRLRLHVLRALIQTRVLVKQGDREQLQQLTQEIEALSPDEDISWNVIRLTLPFFLAVVLGGEGACLISRLQTAQQEMREAGDPLVAIRVSVWLAHSFVQAGKLHRARKEAKAGLALLERIGGRTPWEGQLYYALFLVDYAQGRLEEAANGLKLMLEIAHNWQQVELLVMGEVFSFRLALTKRDRVAAQQSFQQLETLMERERFAARAPWIPILRVQLWLLEGNVGAALAWTVRTILPKRAWNPMSRWEVLMGVRVLLVQQQYLQAAELLSRFQEYFDQPGLLDAAIEWMALSVVVLSRCEMREHAVQIAARLFALVEPEDCVRLDLDSGSPLMREVLEVWLQVRHEEISQASTSVFSQSAILRLLATLERNTPGVTQESEAFSASSKRSPLLSPLSRQEQQVLQMLVAGQTYKEMAQTLVVSPNTIKSQVSSIYRKLGVSRRAEAIAISQRLQLL
ncbi:LuxR C-terminal-related transcriptional regulator [Ktedonobacter robiniae]|nr:LuxR C-terminal-related transcriptional regulator [Ktedonobacter robiniae]